MNEDYTGMGLKFHGTDDYGTFFQAEKLVGLLSSFDETYQGYTINEILELYNAGHFIEKGIYPKTLSKSQRTIFEALKPKIHTTVTKYFSSLDDSTLPKKLTDLNFNYHDDLLKLLVKHKVYKCCTASIVLAALRSNYVRVGEMLSEPNFVKVYEAEIRTLFLSDPSNAEIIIKKYLESNPRANYTIPPSVTPQDIHTLLEAYLSSEDANPNFIKLIATAPVKKEIGVTAKLKLAAKRKYDAWTEDFFKDNAGFETGCELSINADQRSPSSELQRDSLLSTLTPSNGSIVVWTFLAY